ATNKADRLPICLRVVRSLGASENAQVSRRRQPRHRFGRTTPLAVTVSPSRCEPDHSNEVLPNPVMQRRRNVCHGYRARHSRQGQRFVRFPATSPLFAGERIPHPECAASKPAAERCLLGWRHIEERDCLGLAKVRLVPSLLLRGRLLRLPCFLEALHYTQPPG